MRNRPQAFRIAALLLLANVPCVAAQSAPRVLFGHIWKVTQAPTKPALGSIYIFLPNKTLLMTSCVETYRISKWSLDPQQPNVLRVVEDGISPYTLSITKQSNRELRVTEKLTRTGETREFTLSAVTDEFVCPDLPK
jgi:hypothetical protein